MFFNLFQLFLTGKECIIIKEIIRAGRSKVSLSLDVYKRQPADTKKEGPCYDLAIALGVLAAQGLIPLEALSPVSYTHLDVYKRQSIYCY